MSNQSDAISHLRHQLTQPLAVLLADVQLLLLDSGSLDPHLEASLREIERQVLRMRTILQESRNNDG
jgi:signal transduction histidine kinase